MESIRVNVSNTSKDAQAISVLISNGFQLLASVRGDFWEKSPDECMKVAGPLCDLLKSNSQVSKKIQELVPAISLVFGACMLVATPLAIERNQAQIRKLQNVQLLQNQKGTEIGNPGTHSVATYDIVYGNEFKESDV